jgi:hypothetical protein
MFSQGYIGVSKEAERRWNYHKNYGENTHLKNAISKYTWDGLIKEVVLEADMDYCLDIEAKLRPANKIGWNITAGGGKPPVTLWNKGRKIPADELKKLQAKGFGFKKGHKTWNAGITLTAEQKAKQFNLAEYMKDKPQTEEANKKRSLANKGRKFPLIVCPTCAKIGGATAMKRWHFDKCKFKEQK